jgi:phosphatidylinositol-3-phosphatase
MLRTVLGTVGLIAVSLAVAHPAADGRSVSSEQDSLAATASPCVSATGSPDYTHIVIIMDENVSYATLTASSQAAYLHSLAAQCGSETFMHAATHPSQPNYMALASGQATGVGVKPGVDNLFHQVQSHGMTWKSYEESMPKNCSGNSGFYKNGHNPAFWYTDLRTPTNTCAVNDVPLSPSLDNAIAADALPTLSWITPNACNDMHGLAGCPQPSSQRIAAGDAWLSSLIPRLTAMPSYQAGQTLIIVTWDEGNGKEINGSDCTSASVYRTQPSCQIPTIVVSPYVAGGATDSADHNLYGLLGDIEDILGYPRLGRAIGQPTLRSGLGGF